MLNAANEVAVAKFLQGEIGFLDVAKKTLKAMNKFHSTKIEYIDDIFEIDKEVRRYMNG